MAFLTIGLTVIAVPSWSLSLGIQGHGAFAVFFAMLGYSIVNFLLLQHPSIGRATTFITLCLDLLVAVYLIEASGGLKSPLLATQLMFTVLFVQLFPKPLAILPPLLTLPVVAKLDQMLGIRVIDLSDLLILVWYSALNFIVVYVMVYLHEREETAHSDIVALERDLQGFAVIEERNRLSREIHDGLGASLSSLIIQAEYIEGLASSPELKREILELKGCAEDSIDELRRALKMMRADFELVPALEDYCRTFGNRSKLPVQFTKVGLPKALRNDAQLTIFRVLQEALNNARKHAEATELRVELVFDESALRLTIADDGKGFDPKAPKRGHYGVTTMRERAAKVGGETTIDSAPGQGTRITLELPYLPPEVNF
ncbi:MAG: sensor histidine kinase [Myxococcaceae bacterium]|nr:sensor histidine kinase [Myxococcaceae bacterium]